MDIEAILTKVYEFLATYWLRVVAAVVIIAAINKLGVDTASFAVVVGAAGLAVGFAQQGSLANFAAGVMLIILSLSRSEIL